MAFLKSRSISCGLLVAWVISFVACGTPSEKPPSSQFAGREIPATEATLATDPLTSSAFSVTVQPSTLTKSPGQSASVEVTTKIASGYDHALTLKASNLPAGVSVTFSPDEIAAPGAGRSKAEIKLPDDLKLGNYSIHLTATGGSLRRARR